MMSREIQAVEVERYFREQIVARALIEGYPMCAGIFAENHFNVYPDVICLECNAGKLGHLKDPAGLIKMAESVLSRLGIKFRVTVTEVR